jgi:hypothetical protein
MIMKLCYLSSIRLKDVKSKHNKSDMHLKVFQHSYNNFYKVFQPVFSCIRISNASNVACLQPSCNEVSFRGNFAKVTWRSLTSHQKRPEKDRI